MLQTTNTSQRKRYSLKSIFWLVAIFLGALQAWANRYNQTADDIISYLDIGDAYFRGDWDVAINAYWSPLYSWLLGFTLLILKPSPYWEFPVVKLVNFLVYLFSLFCFDFFLSKLIFYYNKQVSQCSPNRAFKISKWVWLVAGYTLFLLSSLRWIGVQNDNPDMLVAAFVYLAAGLVLQIHLHSQHWFNFILLGAVLGLGYLSKAAMLPLAFVFLVVSLFSVSNPLKVLPKVLAALLVFTVLTSPFVVAISTMKGRLTFSDSGKLNYAWLVTLQVKPYRFWQGNEPGSGIPEHPPRQIFENPEVFEFGTPLEVTYPPWHDPSYWYEGIKPEFNFIRQIKVLAVNIFFYYQLFIGSLIFAYLILVFVGGKFWLSVKDLVNNWRLIIPAVAGLAIYMIAIDMPASFMQTRYIAPFIVLLFAGVFSSVRLPDSQESKRLIAGMTLATFLIVVSNQLFYQSAKNLWTVVTNSEQHIEWQVADSLNQLGVHSGEKVAILGAYYHPYYHWARLARVKIVAEIVDEKSFWDANAVVKSDVLETIEQTGAKIIVQKPGFEIPDAAIASGWRKLGKTGYHYFLYK